MGFELLMPDSITELINYLGQYGSSVIPIAGGTDLMLALHRGDADARYVVDITHVDELNRIEIGQNTLRIGACCTFSRIESDPLVRKHAEMLTDAASEVGSRQIRNMGTIGGNIVNASPASDVLPVLYAAGASVLIINGKGDQHKELISALACVGKNHAVGPGELISAVEIPIVPMQISAFVKLSSRRKVSTAKVNVAVQLIRHEGGTLDARVALGAIGYKPLLSQRASEFLMRVPLADSIDTELGRILSEEISAAIPERASVTYKSQAVYGLAADICGLLRMRAERFTWML